MQDLTETPLDETPEPQKRRPLWLLGALALVILLAAAAFLAGRLMNRAGSSEAERGNGPSLMIAKGEGGAAGAVKYQIDLKPAPELPAVSADTRGILTERKDNSLFVGTGKVTMAVTDGEGSQPKTSFDGPVVEVVITQDTKIYHDVTQLNPDNPEATVQQVVELSTLEAVADNSTISAWGKKVGDRIIADVIFFSQPFMIKMPGSK